MSAPLAKIDVPGTESLLVPLAELLLELARAHGFAGERAPELRLALIELLQNALEHGNAMDPARRVRAEATLEGDGRLRISILDEGSGPGPSHLEGDLAAVALSAKRGRGLGMVRRILGEPARAGPRRGEVSIAFDRLRFA